MSEFLFIASLAANGGRVRVHMNDIPRLFSEGAEEPPAPPAFQWQSLWQKLAAAFTEPVGQVKLKLKSRALNAQSRRDLTRHLQHERAIWRQS